ncbi:putative Ig domain-containing protein [Agaribacterium sp. ZY112]|uniref:putative Ig domain-containing protein n=1 Tax=Agaribacterium sp. ZY112 TaxID=3233574 RepID=UPI003526B378
MLTQKKAKSLKKRIAVTNIMPVKNKRKRVLIEPLEAKLLFSATDDIALFDDRLSEHNNLVSESQEIDLSSIYDLNDNTDHLLAGSNSNEEESRVDTLIIIDSSIENFQSLIDQLGGSNNQAEIIVIEQDQDGVLQLSKQLQGFYGIDEVHIFSHGQDGELILGNSKLNNESLSNYRNEINQWSDQLSSDADILIYGCNVAQSEQGIHFIEQLSALSGADIAASNDLSGNIASANWVLEVQHGDIESKNLITDNTLRWQGALGTNDPEGQDKSFEVDEAVAHTIYAIDFGFSDPLDSPWDIHTDVRITTLPATGTLTLDGLAVTAGDVISKMDVDLGKLRFTAGSVDASFTFQVIDDGSANTEDSTPNTMSFVVDSFGNEAPINLVPEDQYTDVDTDLVFSSGNANQIQISDIDANSGSLTVTLSASNGTISIGTPGLVSFSVGDGTSDTTMTFSQTLANINSAIATLTFSPTTNFQGSASISIHTDDEGNTGGAALTDTDVINIEVAPPNTAPVGTSYTLSTPEDTDLVFTPANFGFSDADGHNFAGIVINSLPLVGDFTLNGVDVSLNDFISYADIDAGNLKFSPVEHENATGYASFNFSVRDDGGTETGGSDTDQTPNTLTIDVSYVNDAPENTVPAAQNTDEESPLIISGLSVSDVDAYTFDIQVTLSVDHGIINIATETATVTGNNTATVTLTGTVAEINASLASPTTYTPTDDYFGADTLTMTTSDLGNTGDTGPEIDIDTVTITIDNINDDPTLENTIGNQAATQGSLFSFQFNTNVFDDADPIDSLSYSALLQGGGALPSWLDFTPASRTFSGTPSDSDVGVLTIELTADDGNGGSVTDTFTITVANVDPTVANAIVDQNATQGSAFNFVLPANTFDDVDDDANLILSAQLNGGGSLPSWLTFTPGTGTFSGTPDDADVGTLTIDVTATDSNGAAVTDTFTITVANVDPTVANAIVDQNATQGSAFNFVLPANTFDDVDDDANLILSAQSNGGGSLPSWLTFTPGTGTFSGTPDDADVGTLTIDVTATDSNGAAVTDTFTITVANVDPTVANAIVDQNATQGSAFNFALPANTFDDVDDDANLVLSAQLNGGGSLPSWLTFTPGTGTFSGTPDDADVGTLTIDVTATDSNGAAVTDTFTITVANVDPTVANAIVDQNATQGSAFNFVLPANTFDDVDDDASLVLSAQLNGGGSLPSWLTFTPGTGTFSGTPDDADVGTLTIDVTATDSNGAAVTDTFTITVANVDPTVANAIVDQNATQGSAFNFVLPANTFDDVDDDASLVLSAQLNGGGSLPSWLTFTPGTGTFSGTPDDADVGTLTIDVTATDSNGAAVTDTFTITVANVNDEPTLINPIADQSVNEDHVFSFQVPENTFIDIDSDDSLSYSARLFSGEELPSWLVFDETTRTFNGTPSNSDIGTLIIELIASDGHDGSTASDVFELDILAINDTPSAIGFPPLHNVEDANNDIINLYDFFTDEENGSELVFSVQDNSAPELISNLSISDEGMLEVSYNINQFGEANIVIRASDPEGLWIESSLTIVISSVNDTPISQAIPSTDLANTQTEQQINLNNYFSDVDDENLSYSVTGNSDPDFITETQVSDSGLLTLTAAPFEQGEATLTIRAQDASGAFVDTTYTVSKTLNQNIIPEPPIPPAPSTPDEDDTNQPKFENDDTGDLIRPDEGAPDSTPQGDKDTSGSDNRDSVNEGDVSQGSENAINNPLSQLGGSTDTNYSNTDSATQGFSLDTQVQASIQVTSMNTAQDYDRWLSERSPEADKTLNTGLSSFSKLITPDSGFNSWQLDDFDRDLRRAAEQMQENLEEEQQQKAVLAGLSLSLTTGLIAWSLRASSLLLTLMSMLPLWRGVDPLPILDEVNKKKKRKQDLDNLDEDRSAKEVGYLFDQHIRKEEGK